MLALYLCAVTAPIALTAVLTTLAMLIPSAWLDR